MLNPRQYSKINLQEIQLQMVIQQLFFIIEEGKETILDFSHETVRVLSVYFGLAKQQYKMTQYNTLNVKLCNLQINK